MCCLPRQISRSLREGIQGLVNGGARPFCCCLERTQSCPEEFVTTETYKDIICSCDGIVLYLEMLRKKFPDAVITTYFLGSDQNEQLYAFKRVSYSHGRSRNLDAITIAYGIERRNVWSELSITNDNSAIAHTRGRSVLRPELKITGENDVDELRIPPPGAWKGSDLKLETLVQTMNKATRGHSCFVPSSQTKHTLLAGLRGVVTFGSSSRSGGSPWAARALAANSDTCSRGPAGG